MKPINVRLGTSLDHIMITIGEQLNWRVSQQIYRTLRGSVGFQPSVIDWQMWRTFE